LLKENHKYKRVRPFSQKLRNGIFSIIGNRIIGANVLDLFTGSGSCSIDALCKGARSACMIDNNFRVLKKLSVTTRKLNINKHAKVHFGNVGKIMHQIHMSRLYYDVVFIDPPYNIILSEYFWISLRKVLCDKYILIYRSGSLLDARRFTSSSILDKNVHCISCI